MFLTFLNACQKVVSKSLALNPTWVRNFAEW